MGGMIFLSQNLVGPFNWGQKYNYRKYEVVAKVPGEFARDAIFGSKIEDNVKVFINFVKLEKYEKPL